MVQGTGCANTRTSYQTSVYLVPARWYPRGSARAERRNTRIQMAYKRPVPLHLRHFRGLLLNKLRICP